MRRIGGSLLSAMLGLALAGDARAGLVTYTFSGTVSGAHSTIRLPDGSQSSLIGETVVGTFSYDSSTAAFDSGADHASYATGTLDFVVGPGYLSFAGNPATTTTTVYDQSIPFGGDGLVITDRHSFLTATLTLENPYASVLSSTALPDPLLPAPQFPIRNLYYNNDRSGYSFSVETIFYPAASAIPEPSSFILVASALASLVGLTAARRRAGPVG